MINVREAYYTALAAARKFMHRNPEEKSVSLSTFLDMKYTETLGRMIVVRTGDDLTITATRIEYDDLVSGMHRVCMKFTKNRYWRDRRWEAIESARFKRGAEPLSRDKPEEQDEATVKKAEGPDGRESVTNPRDMRPEDIRAVGEALFGDAWFRSLARALGPHHPRGARESIDHRLVHRWADGERPVPAWVPEALPAIAQDVLAAETGRLERIREIIDMKWR